MATIYLVDNNKDSIKIKKVQDHCMAIALARGYVFVKEENAGDKHHLLEEYWIDSDKYWLQYRNSKVYCIVTNK